MDQRGIPPEIRLGPFILENLEAILHKWEDFARATWVGEIPEGAILRDDAEIMLRALVADMATSQSPADEKLKSEGGCDGDISGLSDAAMSHALARVNDGFDIRRIVAEFRALRASVSKLWRDATPIPHKKQVEDMNRFHEALDQLVAASVNAFTERIEKSRRLFLGILGHDLRQPLHSIQMFATILSHPDPRVDTRTLAARIERSSDAMGKMLADLLDFTSSQLGSRMPVHPTRCDAEAVCAEVVEEVRASSPRGRFTLEASGDATGEWDATRLRQLISNLLNNAVQHGKSEEPISTTLQVSEEEMTLTVHNEGQPIPPASVATLFDPMVRLAPEDQRRPHGSIGLGLFICRQIAIAHRGEITVESSPESGTAFTVKLPKRPVARQS
jgi:signal transduction histidine kinase